MFTRKDLITEVPYLVANEARPVEWWDFGDQDFDQPGWEQNASVFRGSKLVYANARQFWFETLRAQVWNLPSSYVERGMCEPIPEAEFRRVVEEYGRGLSRLPAFVRELVGFRAGLRMYAEWNDVAVVAELDEVCIAFFWSTTA